MSITPPYLKRAQTKDKGYAGKKAETSLAIRLGGSLRPGSGAIASAKGDVTLSVKYDFLIENKTTTNSSFSVKQDHLNKVYKEALDLSKYPALAFQFVNSQGQSHRMDRWVAVPEWVWQEMTAKV